jgi:hypothetical protein
MQFPHIGKKTGMSKGIRLSVEFILAQLPQFADGF